MRHLFTGDTELNAKFSTQWTCESRELKIYMAGDYADAKRICKKFAFVHGDVCVSINEKEYIYRGGYEDGFEVTLINYPRKPFSYQKHRNYGSELAMTLCTELHQLSFTMVYDGVAHYCSRFKD